MLRIIRAFIVVVMLFGLWQCCKVIRPERPEYTAGHLKLAAKASQEAVAWIEKMELEQAKTYFVNLGRDEFGIISLPLRNGIRQLDKVCLVDRTRSERFRESIWWSLPTCGNSQLFLNEAKAQNCKYAIGGRICRFSKYLEKVELVVELELWEVQEPKLLAETTLKLASQDGKIVMQQCKL